MREPPPRQSAEGWRMALYWPGYYLFLAIFGIGAWIANASVVVGARLGRPRNPVALRSRIQRLLACYLSVQRPLCGLHVRYVDWPAGWQQQLEGVVVAANHSSLLDAPFLMARSSRLVCLYKAALGRSLLWRTMAERAGYLSNERGIDAVRQALDELRAGGTLLVFPEGTRTPSGCLGPFESGGALIAMRANAPVQMVLIEMSSPLLSKETSNLRPPRLPATVNVRWGDRVTPRSGESVKAFNARLENAFRSALTLSK